MWLKVCTLLNYLPKDRTSVWLKLKAFADERIIVTERLKFALGRVENFVGKGENAGYQPFLLFPQCFQEATFSGSFFSGSSFPNKPWFLHVCSTSLLKTLWEKEKLLVTSNFSFSHSVFYLFGKLSAIFIEFEIVVCKLFQFGRV